MTKTPIWSQEKFLKAYHFAARAHRGQKYSGTGLPYLMHISFVTMEVCAALTVEKVDDPDLAVQSAILHDVIEDTSVTKSRLKEEFGKAVANGVDALSKNKELKKKDRLQDSIERILEQPTEIWMVKLADRISNLQEPPFHWSKERREKQIKTSTFIYESLKGGSGYLANRLDEKIKAFKQFK